MPNVFLINAHQPYPFSEGRLNQTLIDMAREHLESNGYSTTLTTMTDDWDADAEISKHQAADVVLLQTPVNWMGVPWLFKKYMDLIYTAGMDGRLCAGDGRSRNDPDRQYGTGGTLSSKQYMISLTFNAPANAFDDQNQYLFKGGSIDDLFAPMHHNFAFFGMSPLPSFACYDVLKNPQIDNDLSRWTAHLAEHFPAQEAL
jgi:modulator of drug activity B